MVRKLELAGRRPLVAVVLAVGVVLALLVSLWPAISSGIGAVTVRVALTPLSSLLTPSSPAFVSTVPSPVPVARPAASIVALPVSARTPSHVVRDGGGRVVGVGAGRRELLCRAVGYRGC